MTLKIIDGCIGCGLCESLCPEVFTLGGDGFAEVTHQPTQDNEDKALEAKDSCPVSVIVLDEE